MSILTHNPLDAERKAKKASKVTYKFYLAQNNHFVEIKEFQSLDFRHTYEKEEYPIEGFLEYIFNGEETSFSLGIDFKLPFSLWIEFSDNTIQSLLDINVKSARVTIDKHQNSASVLFFAKKMVPRTKGTLPLDLENK